MKAFLAGEVRHNQSVQYSTPKLFEALTAHVDWMPKEKKAQKEGLSASLEYQSSLLTLALAVDNQVAGDGGVVTGKADPLNSVRAVLTVKPLSSLQLGLLAQNSQGIDQDKSEETNWLASAQWTIDKLALKAQFGQGLADKTKTGAKTDAGISQAVLGVDYILGKNTTTYVYSGITRYEDGAGGTVAGKSREESTTGFGLKYKF
jgi:predicted porin